MKRVLLIEDNRDHLELMAYLLRSQGYTPLSAGSAECGRMMLQCCQQIDLIICDIRLGEVSGIDLVRTLRKSKKFSGIRIVAVTAGSMGQAQEALNAGFDHYMLKPIDPEKFVAEVMGRKNDLVKPGPRDGAPMPDTSKPGPPLARSAMERGPSAGTVLAVDDRIVNLELIRALLPSAGYRVITAGGVREALDRAHHIGPDLIITDVHMGDGSGFDLIRLVQKDAGLRKIPWLVTSATYLAIDWRAEEIGLDESNFLLQPWEPEVLLAKIKQRIDPQTARHRSAGV